MISLLLYCVTIGWDPASGPVDSYTLYLDTIVHQEGIRETQASVCLRDTNPHTLTVQAFDTEGSSGPLSDASEVIQMEINPPLHALLLHPTIRADFDGSCVVGFPDFTAWSNQFGARRCISEELP